MAQVHVVPDADRLPWLTDDVQPVRRRPSGLLLAWALAVAAALVAAIVYGTAATGGPDRAAPAAPGTARTGSAGPSDSAEPPPLATPTQEVQPAPMPEVQPAPEPAPVTLETVEAPAIAEPAPVLLQEPEPLTEAAPTPDQAAAATTGQPVPEGSAVAQATPPAASVPENAPPVVRTPLRPWPAAQSTGASGRMVRVGTFASRLQAKRAWWRVVRTYPGLRRLKAVVVPVASLRNGRTYYRLQFGTTSHAHSVVLCQRMRIVGQSCVPVGLPPGLSRA